VGPYFTGCSSKRGQAEFGFTKLSTDINNVADSRTRPDERPAGSNLAHYGYVYGDSIVAGRIATGNRALQLS